MTRLNQIVAIEKGAKATGEGALTRLYHNFQRQAQWGGLIRTYVPKDDDGDKLPPESTLVQIKGAPALKTAARELARLLDVTATKDMGNTVARADVVVDGVMILTQVSVTTLLALEKKLDILRTTVLSKIPTLDSADTWEFDDNEQVYRSVPVGTIRTKKIPRNHVKAAATDKHPAQVEVYYEDVNVGTWTTTKLSGAFSSARKAELLEKVAQLAEAVKKAREEANSVTVEDVKIGDRVFEFLGW
jgi:hypothetical protein